MHAYSVLTHQAIIDAAWESSLVPALEKRFPGATQQELHKAHAFAYGGAIMPDMGYYPLGSTFFTDLVHYVRTGDFTKNLLEEATTRNELAFALGALAHYYGDVHGHAIGTNTSVPLVYPDTKAKFGDVVTYEDDPVSHMRMEFGFDVLQAARGNYAPQAFRDFIGFEISEDVLERAFFRTYGIKLRNTFVFFPVAETVFRLSVKAVIPQIVKIGWGLQQAAVSEKENTPANMRLARKLGRASFRKEFNNSDDSPGATAWIFAMALRFVPKFGMLQPLKFKLPTPEAEKLFVASFAEVLSNFKKAVDGFPEASPELPNLNFDTGHHASLLEYGFADNVYSKLLAKLADEEFETASQGLLLQTARYFEKLPPPPDYRKEKKEWRRTKEHLAELNEAIAEKAYLD